MRDPKSYDVGYKKPPVEHQFKPGICPNPAGRGKRPSQKIGQAARTIMEEKLQILSQGRKSRLSRLRLLIRSCIQSAAKGDVHSAAFLLKLREFTVSQPSNQPFIIKIIGGLPDDN